MKNRARIRRVVVVAIAVALAVLGLWGTKAADFRRVQEGRDAAADLAVPGGAVPEGAARTANVSPAKHSARSVAPTAGSVPVDKAPFNVAAVIEQVRSSFEATREGFRGGRATYDVRATSHGIALKARHYASPGQADALQSDELVLRTAHVGRDSVAPNASNAGTPQLEEKAQLVSWARGNHTERLRQTSEGVEQSWAFAAAPEGSGDLIVRVDVSGLKYAGESATGLHFADARGLGFRYGNGTWVDATGAKTAVKARYAGGAIELAVPRDLVESSAYPAVLDPIVGPEFGLEPVLGPARENQLRPSIASNGSGYLLVWADRRGGAYGLFASRVSAAGGVLDGAGLVVAVGLYVGQGQVGVASNGLDYLVVWADPFRIVYASRVSGNGELQDAVPVALASATEEQIAPSVASNGTDYLVAWQDGRSASSWDVYASRVSAAGVVQDAAGVAVSTATGHQTTPSVASNGTGYLVAWSDARSGGAEDVYASRVSAAGVVQDATGLAVSTATGAQYNPSVASNGSDYLVAWQDGRGSSRDIYASRVSGAGLVQDSAGLAVSTAVDNQERPNVASNGTDYLVAWVDKRRGLQRWDVFASRVTAAGQTLDAAGVEVSMMTANETEASTPDPWNGPQVASNGSSYFVAWMGFRGTGWNVYVSQLGADAVVNSAGSVVSLSASDQMGTVASNGSDFLVVWSENRTGYGADIYASRVTGAGVVADPLGLPVSTAPGAQVVASVASNGSDYLVTWNDDRAGNPDVYAARVSSAGMVLDLAGVPVATGAESQFSPSVASDGSNYLVAWSRGESGYIDIDASRVSASGVVQDSAGIVVSTAANDQLSPQVASNGSAYLVTWEDRRTASSAIYASRVSVGGVVLDGIGLLVSQASGPREFPSVASNGEDYLVAWSDGRNGNWEWDVYASRVSSAGVVEDSAGLAVATIEENAEGAPNVSWNGLDYLVAWIDYDYSVSGSTVRAATLAFDPTFETTELVIDAEGDNAVNPQVASFAGRYLVSYSERDAFIQRLHLRLITPDCSSDPLGDEDADGVCDSVDNCLDVANYDEKDTDGDSLGDACDACPSDPDKVEVGQCGCSAPDTDADADGTANCDDGCPNDPKKVSAGTCGCGSADADTDGDGSLNCLDICPLDERNHCYGSAQGGAGPNVNEGGAGPDTTKTGGAGGMQPDVSGGTANEESGEDDPPPACGCRMVGESPSSPAALLAFAAGLGLIAARRRQRAA